MQRVRDVAPTDHRQDARQCPGFAGIDRPDARVGVRAAQGLAPDHAGLHDGTAQIELGSILGQACGSSAWVQCVLASHGWIMGMYPPEAQEAVWGDKPETIVGTAFTAETGVAKVVDRGYEVQGQWKFSS